MYNIFLVYLCLSYLTKECQNWVIKKKNHLIFRLTVFFSVKSISRIFFVKLISRKNCTILDILIHSMARQGVAAAK